MEQIKEQQNKENIKELLEGFNVSFEVEKIIKDDIRLIKALSDIKQKTDDYTFSHTIRTTEITYQLANKLKLNKDNIFLLTTSALLHDIGKTDPEIAPLIISSERYKNGDEELEIIRGHVRKSINYCLDNGFNDQAKIMAYHHELKKGKKAKLYPRKGSDRRVGSTKDFSKEKNRRSEKERRIPNVDNKCLGKIFSIIDVYDSLVSKRSYKESIPPMKCRETLTELFPEKENQKIIDILLNKFTKLKR